MNYKYSKPFGAAQHADYFLQKKLGKLSPAQIGIFDQLIETGELGQYGLEMHQISPMLHPRDLRDLEEAALTYLHQRGMPVNSKNIYKAAEAVEMDFLGVDLSKLRDDPGVQVELSADDDDLMEF